MVGVLGADITRPRTHRRCRRHQCAPHDSELTGAGSHWHGGDGGRRHCPCRRRAGGQGSCSRSPRAQPPVRAPVFGSRRDHMECLSGGTRERRGARGGAGVAAGRRSAGRRFDDVNAEPGPAAVVLHHDERRVDSLIWGGGWPRHVARRHGGQGHPPRPRRGSCRTLSRSRSGWRRTEVSGSASSPWRSPWRRRTSLLSAWQG
jgi:hypothetical protein